MKKIAGIVLIALGMGLLVWYNAFQIIDFLPRIGLNMAGFMVIAFGVKLFKSKTEKSTKPSQKSQKEKLAEQKPPRNQTNENPERFMPK